MRPLRASVCAALVTSIGAAGLAAFVPAADAASTPGIHITEFAYGGKVSGSATGGDGEYAELTNTGSTPVDLTGWTYDTGSSPSAATGLSLSGLGTVAPGVSVIVTDVSDTEFRTDWGLKDSVKVLSNGKTHTLNSGPSSIHIYDKTGADVDSLTYASGFESAKGKSAWVDAAHVGSGSTTAGWTISTLGDAEESWTSATGSVGSPGASNLGTVNPSDIRTGAAGGAAEAPCDTEVASGSGVAPASAVAWPGGQTPAVIDAQCAWVTDKSGQDLSGLAFDPSNANVLYAVKNKNHVYRLVKTNGVWAKDTTNGWSAGKDILFPGGVGQPDSEGLTVGPDGKLYITTERDNANKNVPLDTILQFDPTSADASLTATAQWTLTPDLGFAADDADDANLGFEGVAYVPDSFLVASGFKLDDGTTYNPASYPTKAVPGLFLGAVEKTGHLRAYELNTDGTWARLADIATGMAGVMDASYDADLGRVWAHCDNTCDNATALLKIGADGKFAVDTTYAAPTGLPDYNLEGFAVAPASTATGGTREVLWTDDGNRFGHSLWSGTVNLDLGLAQTRTPQPTISGTPVVGGTLAATVGTWDPGVTTHYQWKDGATVLATDAPLSVGTALAGKTITLAVTGTRTGFATATTTATVVVRPGTITAAKPKLKGQAKVGHKLTAKPGPWSAGGTRVELAYKWFADGKAIRGEKKAKLKLTKAMKGDKIAVQVTGTAAGYATVVETSKATKVK